MTNNKSISNDKWLNSIFDICLFAYWFAYLKFAYLLILVLCTGLSLLVSKQFQVLFHALLRGLFTFPSRYWFTIGLFEYLALVDGSTGFPQKLRLPWYSGAPRVVLVLAYKAFTFFGALFRGLLLTATIPYWSPTTPLAQSARSLGFSAFARRY